MNRSVQFLLVLVFLLGSVNVSTAKAVFIPNGGQWHENALMKCDLQGGSVFMEKDGFTFSFYDQSTFHNLHEGGQDSVLHFHAFKMAFLGSNSDVQVQLEEKTEGAYNYFIGDDHDNWASNLVGGKKVTYYELYDKINLSVYQSAGGLKYEFFVLPGGNTNDIQIQFSGLDSLGLIRNQIHLFTSLGKIIDESPYVYQNDSAMEIKSNYVLDQNILSFAITEKFDHTDTLVVDPELIFSTYSGSFSDNFGYTATYDNLGFLYAGGSVFGPSYPVTLGAYDITFNSYKKVDGNSGTWGEFWGISDMGISKYDTSGTKMIYSTYVGGSFCELPTSLVVNDRGELYILGSTSSSDYPTSATGYDQVFNGGDTVDLTNGVFVNYVNGSDLVVTKLSADGSALLGSTFLGGDGNDGLNFNASLRYNYADELRGEILLDGKQEVYVVSSTNSTNYPVTTGAHQTVFGGIQDGVITKFNTDLSNILWSSYIGGSDIDALYSVVLDKDDNPYVAGGTVSTDYPTTAGSYSPAYSGGRSDGVITHFDKTGASILESTFYGSDEYDQIYFIEKDKSGSIYIYGQTEKYDSTFIDNALYSKVGSGMLLSKFDSSLTTRHWSTIFGSGINSVDLSPTAFMVDLCDKIYLSGWGGSTNFPSANNQLVNDASLMNGLETKMLSSGGIDYIDSTSLGSDFYLMMLEKDASALNYATFFGGNQSNEHVDGGTSRFDPKGKIYQSVCAGCGGNNDFPIKPVGTAHSSTNNGNFFDYFDNNYGPNCNNGLFKFDFRIPTIVADFIVPNVGCLDTNYHFLNTSNVRDSTTYLWSFGDDSTSTIKNPSHKYLNSGTYVVKLIIRDPTSCNLGDSISKIITLRDDSLILSKQDTSCIGDSLQIDLGLIFPISALYSWSPGSLFSDSATYLPKVLTDSSLNLTLIVTSEPGCADTVLYPIYVPDYVLKLSDTIACVGDTILNYVESNPNFVSYQWSVDTSFSSQLNLLLTDTSFMYPVIEVDTVFYVKVIDLSGCEFIDSLTIKGINFDLELSSDTIVCDTNRVRGNVLNYNLGQLDSIAWSPNGKIFEGIDSTSALLGLDYGTNEFLVYARDTFGCVDVDTLNHVLRSDSLTYAKIDTSCEGDSLQIDLPLSFLPSSTYLWTPGILFSDSTIYLPKVLTDSTVSLGLVVTEVLGCTDTILYPIFVPTHKLALSDSIVCFGDTVLNFVQSDPSFVMYQWSTDTSFSDQLNVLNTDTAFSYVVAEGDTTFYIKVTDVTGCEFIDSLQVVGVNFQIETNLDTIVCDFVPVWEHILNHQMSRLDSIAWSPTIHVIQGVDSTHALLKLYDYVSEYQVFARDTNGCADIDTIKIVDSSLNLDLSDTTICFGDTIQLGFELSHNPLYTYEWIPNVIFEKDSLKTKAALKDSVKLQLIVDNSFCIDTVNQFVSVNKIVITSAIDSLLCNNLQSMLVEVVGEDTLTYYWYNDSTLLDTIQNGVGVKTYDFVPPNGETILYIQAQDDFGCQDSAEIKVRSSFFELTYPRDSTLCLNDTVVLAPEEDLSEMGSMKFAWSPSEVIHSDTTLSSVQVYDPENGQWTIKVVAENEHGCEDVDSIILSFSSLDTTKISATVTPETILDTESAVIEVTPENYKYSISPEEDETTQEENSFTVFPKESKTYLLTVIDSLYNKCRNITSVSIEVLKFVCDDPYIYVPNAFTPNGDGENDVLFVRGKNITKLYFAIFNRWGQKVFETELQHVGWDGLYKGMKIDPAVYDYYLKYECEGEEEHFKKGNITLIR
ncbi:MAG: gliding motility-associated-like protein [Saprospiraceae bacterium]|jgi:gliding motility-associated-like protein